MLRNSLRHFLPKTLMSTKNPPAIVLTCEHGGNRIPANCRQLFADAAEVLSSHRGWDPGAWPLAQSFSKRLAVPLTGSKISRLVVELNRSLHHPKLFSEYTQSLPAAERKMLVAKHWQPHRDSVQNLIGELIRQHGTVVHLSVHTFTEFFGVEVRKTEIGLLYDSRRTSERRFCASWADRLRDSGSSWKIRKNHPYNGSADGFTTALRKQFSPAEYIGIELEVCQKFFLRGGSEWKRIRTTLPETFHDVVQSFHESVCG